MVGFIATAGMGVQGSLQSLLPTKVDMPSLPYSEEIENTLSRLKSNPMMNDLMADMPSMLNMNTIDMSMDGDADFEMPAETLEVLQNSDVTTITENTKAMAEAMFSQMTPKAIAEIQAGINKGIDGINAGMSAMMSAQGQMGHNMSQGMEGMPPIVADISAMKTLASQMETMRDAVPEAFDTALENYLNEIDNNREVIEVTFQKTLNEGFSDIYLLTAVTAAIALALLGFYKGKKDPAQHIESK